MRYAFRQTGTIVESRYPLDSFLFDVVKEPEKETAKKKSQRPKRVKKSDKEEA